MYSNVYFVMKTNTNIYSSTKIFEYSNIQIFVLIPARPRVKGLVLDVSIAPPDETSLFIEKL